MGLLRGGGAWVGCEVEVVLRAVEVGYSRGGGTSRGNNSKRCGFEIGYSRGGGTSRARVRRRQHLSCKSEEEAASYVCRASQHRVEIQSVCALGS